MKDVLISIIVPVYNVESYLPHCLNSIIHQTYEKTEIIIVDDGSTDGSEEICDRYAQFDERIKVIHKANGGLSEARNIGIQESTGEIVAFVDADDWIDLNLLKTIMPFFDSDDIDIVCFGYYVTDGQAQKTEFLSGQVRYFDNSTSLEWLCRNEEIQSHAWSKLYRRSMFDGIQFPKNRYYEDIFIMHNVFSSAKRVVFLDRPLYYYLMRGTSITGCRKWENDYEQVLAFWRRYTELKKNENKAVTVHTVKCIILSAIYMLHTAKSVSKYEQNRALSNINDILDGIIVDSAVVELLSVHEKIEFLIFRKMPVLYYPIYKMYVLGGKRSIQVIKNLGDEFKRTIKVLIRIIEAYKCHHIYSELDKEQKKILLLGSPEYENLGDHAIAFYTSRFISKEIGAKLYEITENQVNYCFNRVRKRISEEDLILLQGGGNFGDVYMDQEKIRERVVRAFPNNRVLLMPQSCFFKNGISDDVRNLYSRKNVTLCAREIFSYEKMRENFCTQVMLAPDIVLSADIYLKNEKRKGVGLCFRNDIESSMNLYEKDYVSAIAQKHFRDLKTISTVLPYRVDVQGRGQELDKILYTVSGVELLITDRLHAMIFAVITNTPCIVIDNTTHKIRGTYSWLEGSQGVEFVEDPYMIEDYILSLKGMKCNFLVDTKLFACLREVIEEWKCEKVY